MERQYEPIGRLLQRVRARYRALSVFDAIIRAALATSGVVGAALAAWSLASLDGRSPLTLACVGGAAFVLAAGAAAWGLLPLREVPSDLQMARFIEERVPDLDDRLATAVDVVAFLRPRSSQMLLQPLVEDAARRVDALDLDAIVPSHRLRRGGLQAGAAAIVLLVLVFMAREPARQSVDAASLALFPAQVRLEVLPGDARVKQGAPLAIQAHLVGNRAPIVARAEIGEGTLWRSAEMSGDGGGQFRLSIESVASAFKYRVVAGALASRTYEVKVVHPPRVVRIDVDYIYPASLRLPPRTETDGGDVYAPAGTNVRLHINTDRPVADGRLSLANGQSIGLAALPSTSSTSPTQLVASMTVVEDGSYRVALRDPEGVTDAGQNEYFIRILEDRPPEVHIVKPASDRSVTPLEEVDIEAQADDDYGIEQVDLVYAVRGQTENVVPLALPRRATSVTVRHTVYLEDLDVKPGDFVSYYVRARDVTRGSRSNEGRSDIFFLEVRPFEQEFSLAQSQSMAGAGYTGSIDDLVNAQKQIVVATWKLDRRGQNLKGTQSPPDIRSIGRSEAELKARVEETASSLRESTLRDPRRRLQGRGGESPDGPKVGQTMLEEDAMAEAAEAMGQAVASLDALKTGAALPPEMQALNALLEAQALVKKRQVSRQQSAQGGPGNNNRNYDISTLFDKELQRQQETRYETRAASSTEPQSGATNDALEKIRDLARRQDELLRRQQDLARQQLTEHELTRQLEKLTREQSELRRQAEELARQMSKLESGQGRQAGLSTPATPSSQSPSGTGQTTRRLRDISDDMRSAASELRRQGSSQAGASGSRALEKLKDLERRLRGDHADRRRAGDLQLEARQLADAERQVAADIPMAGGPGREDAMRRLAGEQQRLADRAGRLQEGVKQPAAGTAARAQAARLVARMRQLAEALREAAQDKQSGEARTREASAEPQAIARDLDKLADVLSPGGGANDRESAQLSEALSKARALRENIDSLTRQIEKPGASGDRNRLREQAARELQQARELIDELRRQDPSLASGGRGLTFEGQGFTFSAPGTEGFKQDFAKWEALRDQATRALERVESSLSKRLQEKETHDRLAAGIDDKAPAAYRQQVDNYFKALAARKAP